MLFKEIRDLYKGMTEEDQIRFWGIMKDSFVKAIIWATIIVGGSLLVRHLI